MKKFVSFLLCVMILASIVLTGCSAKSEATQNTDTPSKDAPTESVTEEKAPAEASSTEPIVMAYIGPLTGDNSEYGVGMMKTVQFAIDQQNEKGGLLGRQIELITFDDKNNNEEAISCAEKIVSDKRVCAVIGHFSSGVAMAAAPIFQEAGIPVLNGSAAHVDYTGYGDCIFRNNTIYSRYAIANLQAVEYCGGTKFADFHPNTDAGKSLAAEIEARLSEMNGKFPCEHVATEFYNDGSVDYTAAITKFIELGVDTVITSAPYSTSAPFIKQYKERDPDIKVVGTESCFSAEFIELGGDAVEGTLMPCSFFYLSEQPNVVKFNEEFQEALGIVPNTFYAQVYDNACLVFAAIEAGQSSDPQSIKENLYNVKIDGVAGNIGFDAQGEVSKSWVLLKVQDGSYVEIPGALANPDEWMAQFK